MATEVFGEYSAYNTPGGVRFQKNKKLVSAKSVPPEVVQFLTNKVNGAPRGEPVQKFAKPSPEELAKIRAEQLAPKPGLEAAPEKLEVDRLNAEDHLTPDDFDEPPVPVDPSPPEEVVEEVQEALETPHAPEPGERLPNNVDPNFLETVSIHTASLDDMVEALYNRFGIYTVYLRKLPEADEMNPLTGTRFTKYHLGIAYQAAIFAQNQGLLDLPPEYNRKMINQGRDASANMQMDKAPETFGEARRANSFDFRTSVRGNENVATTEVVHITDPETGIVHAVQREIPAGEQGASNGAAQRYDKDEDERIVEPRFGKQVIRPDW